jgi:RNA polymerase sigma-70 factor, ECF subfamily
LAERSSPTAPQELDAWVLADAAEAVAYATSLLRDQAAAEDVVQDCFCRLLARADVYDLPRDGRKLLFRAITNAVINIRTRARPMLRLAQGGEDAGIEVGDRRTQPPERVLMNRELEQAIADGLALLPLKQRAALELKALGHTQEEIGEALGVRGSTAGVLIHRARQAMARHLVPFVEEQAG